MSGVTITPSTQSHVSSIGISVRLKDTLNTEETSGDIPGKSSLIKVARPQLSAEMLSIFAFEYLLRFSQSHKANKLLFTGLSAQAWPSNWTEAGWTLDNLAICVGLKCPGQYQHMTSDGP